MRNAPLDMPRSLCETDFRVRQDKICEIVGKLRQGCAEVLRVVTNHIYMNLFVSEIQMNRMFHHPDWNVGGRRTF